MSNVKLKHTYRPCNLRSMQDGDLLGVSVSKGGFSQQALCEFIKIEKGMVHAKVIEFYSKNNGHRYPELTEGNVVKARAKKCFLYGHASNKIDWPIYVWFKGLDEPV